MTKYSTFSPQLGQNSLSGDAVKTFILLAPMIAGQGRGSQYFIILV